uniref:Uncharacterized protein n=1 Tax=Parascaris equorum TaxID=6256 RepID=A0A914SHP3_PAREQ
MLDLVDAASILFRLHMEGVDVSNRWNALLPIAQSHMDGEAVCEAISAYWANDFDAVISRLAPIRKKICEIGGSNAQRDIFTQILINSCLRSSNENNNRLAK